MSEDPSDRLTRRNVLLAAATGATLSAVPACEPDRASITPGVRRAHSDEVPPSDDAVHRVEFVIKPDCPASGK